MTSLPTDCQCHSLFPLSNRSTLKRESGGEPETTGTPRGTPRYAVERCID